MLLSIALQSRLLTLRLSSRLIGNSWSLSWLLLLGGASLNLVSWFGWSDALIALEDNFFSWYKITLPVTRFAFTLRSNTWHRNICVWILLNLILSDRLICVVVGIRTLVLLLLNFGFQNHREVVLSNSARAHSWLLHVWMNAHITLTHTKKWLVFNSTYFCWLSYLPIWALGSW